MIHASGVILCTSPRMTGVEFGSDARSGSTSARDCDLLRHYDAGSIFETRRRRAIPPLLYSRFTVLVCEIGILSARPSREPSRARAEQHASTSTSSVMLGSAWSGCRCAQGFA